MSDVSDATPCACTGYTLSLDTLRHLREQYATCVCMHCLAELQTRTRPPGETAPP